METDVEQRDRRRSVGPRRRTRSAMARSTVTCNARCVGHRHRSSTTCRLSCLGVHKHPPGRGRRHVQYPMTDARGHPAAHRTGIVSFAKTTVPDARSAGVRDVEEELATRHRKALLAKALEAAVAPTVMGTRPGRSAATRSPDDPLTQAVALHPNRPGSSDASRPIPEPLSQRASTLHLASQHLVKTADMVLKEVIGPCASFFAITMGDVGGPGAPSPRRGSPAVMVAVVVSEPSPRRPTPRSWHQGISLAEHRA